MAAHFRPETVEGMVASALIYNLLLGEEVELRREGSGWHPREVSGFQSKLNLLVQLGAGSPGELACSLLEDPALLRKELGELWTPGFRGVGQILREQVRDLDEPVRQVLLQLIDLAEVPGNIREGRSLPEWVKPRFLKAYRNGFTSAEGLPSLIAQESAPRIQEVVKELAGWWFCPGPSLPWAFGEAEVRTEAGFVLCMADPVVGSGGYLGISLNSGRQSPAEPLRGERPSSQPLELSYDMVLFSPVIARFACLLRFLAKVLPSGNLMERLLRLAGVEPSLSWTEAIPILSGELEKVMILHETRHCEVHAGQVATRLTDPSERTEWDADSAVVELLADRAMSATWAVAVARFLLFSAWPQQSPRHRGRSAKDVVFLRAMVDHDPLSFLERRRRLAWRKRWQGTENDFLTWRNRSAGQLRAEAIERLSIRLRQVV